MPISAVLYNLWQQKNRDDVAVRTSRGESVPGVTTFDDGSGRYDRSSILEKYDNTRFKDILESNPYLNYQPGLIDYIGNAFGFGTTQDEYEKAAREYDAQVAQLASEEKYNTPAEQAARERVAGLNPDLVGVSGEAASEFNQEQTSPDAQSNLSLLTGLGSTILSVFGSVAGFAKDVESLKQLRNATEAGDIANAKGMLELGNEVVKSLMHEEDGELRIRGSVNTAYDWLKDTFHSRRALRRFSVGVTNAINDLRNRSSIYGSIDALEGSRKRLAEKRGSMYYRDNDVLYRDMIAPFVRLTEKYNSQYLHYNKQKVDSLDPNLAAAAENAVNKNTAASSNFENEINSTMRAIVHNLAKDAQNGSEGAAIGLLIFQALRNSSLSFKGASIGR